MSTHDTTIDGTQASCPCGWTHTSADLGTLQAAALAHELNTPADRLDQYRKTIADTVEQTQQLARDVETAEPATPPHESGGALATEQDSPEAAMDAEIVAGKLASVASRINRKRAEADALMQERDAHVCALRAAGWSYRKIAELAGMAHQRVEQIVTSQ